MYRAALISLFTLVATYFVTAQTSGPAPRLPGGQQELAALERQWNEAYKNRDKPSLERLLDVDFVFTDDEGHVFTRAAYIDAVVKLVKVGSYQLGDMAFRVHGTSGVVTGLWTGSFSIDGVDASGALRFTDTFTKESGTWKVWASHETRIPKATK
jgi:ketosteroid isomerase-like protein